MAMTRDEQIRAAALAAAARTQLHVDAPTPAGKSAAMVGRVLATARDYENYIREQQADRERQQQKDKEGND